MKLSIWQQFSSNHSAFFTVMGKFQTPDEAQLVAERLRLILYKIARWREDQWEIFLMEEYFWQDFAHRDDLDDKEYWYEIYESDYADVTAIDEEINELDGINISIHNIEFARYTDEAPKAVRVFDRTVIIAEELIGYYTHSKHQPFVKFMSDLGGEVVYSSEVEGTNILINVTCLTPDDATADTIMQSIKVSFQHNKSYLQLEGVFEDKYNQEKLGSIQRDGLKIIFTDLDSYFDCGYVLINLVNYLKSLGCTNIQYTLSMEK